MIQNNTYFRDSRILNFIMLKGSIKVSKRLTIENIKEFVKNNSNCELISTEYINNYSKMTFTCENCGEEFSVSFNTFQSGHHSCKKCSYEKRAKKSRKSYNDVKNYIQSMGCELISEEYKNKDTKLKILCGRCKDKVFYSTLRSIQKRKNLRCPDCDNEIFADNQRFTYEYVENFVNNNSNCKLISTEYIDANKNLEFKCGCDDNTYFSTSFASFKYAGKRQCNNCSENSNLQKISREFFIKNNIDFVQEKTFDDCRNPLTNFLFRYDFFLTNWDRKILIECQGRQHELPSKFKNSMTDEEAEYLLMYQKYKDYYKDMYAFTHGYYYFKIWYYEMDKIEEILTEKLGVINHS